MEHEPDFTTWETIGFVILLVIVSLSLVALIGELTGITNYIIQ